MNPLDELHALARDLRAVLDDARVRGVTVEPSDAPLPPAIAPDAPLAAAAPSSAGPSAARPAATPAISSAWAKIAEASRKDADVGADRGARGLQSIRDDLGDCRRCGLCMQRKSIVFGVGDPDADLAVIGEGPGHEEDLSGEPFVGPAGQMLDKMLLNVLGLARQQVYIANIVKCRPPGNRNPLPDEVAACRPFLERQLKALQPKLILVLGSVALKALLGSETGIMKMRGTWQQWEGIPVLPTFHPAYLLRNPDEKRKTFEDLKVLRSAYDSAGGKR